MEVFFAATAPTSLIAVNATLPGAGGVTYAGYGVYNPTTGVFTLAAAFNDTTAPDAIIHQSDGGTVINSVSNAGWAVLVGLNQALVAADFV